MKKKRNKKHKPKPIRIPKMVMQHRDFEQIDTVLRMIENGEVDEVDGNVVMTSPEGELYQVAPALESWCNYWQEISKGHGVSVDDSALRTLINKINYNIEITTTQIKEAKKVVDVQRSLFMQTGRNTIEHVAKKHKIYLEES